MENDVIDRISDLPDLVLCKILSFVPTKHAVATSILSTRWKKLFPIWIPPIKLDLAGSNSFQTSFMVFVDTLLNRTLRHVRCVDTIILKCNDHYSRGRIMTWIIAALRLNVQDLELQLSFNWPMNLFRHLNSCKSLVRLVFMHTSWARCIMYELHLPNNFSLPNLKVLALWNALWDERYYDKTGVFFINALIAGCPALEDLCIRGCEFRDVKSLYIESHVLKNITIDDCWTDSPDLLEINAPNLKTLIYINCYASKYHIRNFKSLNMASIQVCSRKSILNDNGVAELVSACSGTVRLYLAACSVKALQSSSMKLPTFQNLSWLELGRLELDGWAQLACLLHNAPFLQRLILEEGFKEHEGGYKNFESSVPTTPICLKLHLKEIDYWVFKGVDEEIELIEYFLKNGQALQKIKLHCSLLDQDLIAMKRMLVLPSNKNFQLTEIENGVQISPQPL